MTKSTKLLLAAACLGVPTTAHATDDDFELWINPSISFDLDDNTGMELETAQRLRDSQNGREDTYFGRLWLNQRLNDTVTLAGAVERRINDGGSDETRLIQQMSTRHGILRTRLRVEQRFVDDADQMGIRVRPRLGVAVPLDDDGKLSFNADAELFVTLRSNNSGGDTGLTGMRTQVGLSYDISDRLSLSAVYLRDQDFEDGRPDTVGHAPLIGIEYSF